MRDILDKEYRLEEIEELGLEKIDRPSDSARIEIERGYIEELADSIHERGQLEPIRVRKVGGRYEIIFGDRRYLACQKLKRETISAVVVEASDGDVLVDRTIENVQRVNLTPLEEAREYDRLVRIVGMSFEKVAKLTGKSAGTVKRSLEILKMPEYMQKELQSRRISKSVAEELFDCPDDGQRRYFVEMAAEHGIKKEIARQWVGDYRKSLRGSRKAGENGLSLGRGARPSSSFITCYLCDGPVDIIHAESISMCPGCKRELGKMLEK